MSAPSKFVFYTARVCPYAQRAAIALAEANVPYEHVEIDLQNKPSWYGDVNPDLKVPALKIDDKSIAESLVLIELVNDLYPEVGLLPDDPVKRAQGRFAIEFYSSKILPNLYGILKNPDNKNSIINDVDAAYKRFNELLLEQSATGPYFYGDKFSLVDVAIAPFAGRFRALLKLAFGDDYQVPTIKSSPRLNSYLSHILDRPSYKDTYYGDEAFAETAAKRFNFHVSK